LTKGSSDPYVKFQLNGVNVFKSKIIRQNLNPEWNEEFSIKLAPSLISRATIEKMSAESASLISWNQKSFEKPILPKENLNFFLSLFKLSMTVFDYDRGFLNDDLIGNADIDLTQLEENS
jgi:Ca2+-dependent lipid-binding protein